jgi:hypothetical protein
MSIRLFCPDETAPVPRAVWMELNCDGPHCGLVEEFATFRQDGYIAQRRAASQSGWVFTGDGKHYGPYCSKKKIVCSDMHAQATENSQRPGG